MGAVAIKAVKTRRGRGGVVLGEGARTVHGCFSTQQALRALGGGLGQNAGSHRDLLCRTARCEGEPMSPVPGSRSRGGTSDWRPGGCAGG